MNSQLAKILQSHRTRIETAFLVLAVVASSWLAWHKRFIQDDAFISFRYARNLSEGLGLTFNPGERVEGYTNFLWTVLMALPFRFGADPLLFSTAVGLLLYPLSLLLAYWIGVRVVGSRGGGLLVLLLLGTNHTFSAFATGGLETQLHVLLLLSITALALGSGAGERARPWVAVSISLLGAAALMTRMDSAVYLTIVYGFIGLELYKYSPRDGAPRKSLRFLLLASLPGALCVLAWLAWKVSYYGDILPNTYYAKMLPLSESWYIGLRYLWTFVRSYWLLPVAALCLVLTRPPIRAWDRRAGLMAFLVVAGCAYVLRVGGDFMEFRLLVPVLPFAFVWLSWLLVRAVGRPVLTAAVAAMVIGGSYSHASSFGYVHGIESVRILQDHIEEPSEAWATTGRVLGELFGGLNDPPRIATTASGAVPFYSRLPTTDMLGLTDPWVARHGIRGDPRAASPGHHRVTTYAHLVEEDVNLVVGRPWVTERLFAKVPAFGSRGLLGFGAPSPSADEVPANAAMQVLEIALDHRHRVFVLYLMRHDGIDQVIRERAIPAYPLNGRRDAEQQR